jgi:hypothetical protein
VTTVLAPADVEAALYAFLPAPVGTRIPDELGDEFTRVTRAGGDRLNLAMGVSRVLVECFGVDDDTAFAVARKAWGLLGAAGQSYLVPGVWVTRVQLTDPVNFPDPSTKHPRYQFVASLTLSLTPLEI